MLHLKSEKFTPVQKIRYIEIFTFHPKVPFYFEWPI